MKYTYWITWVILILAILGAGSLSYTELIEKDVCPKMLGIPACYIVLVSFTMAGIMHALKTPLSNYLYFAAIGFVLFFALKGTITELRGIPICPRTAGGTPMCFISLGLCISLITAKFISLKTNT